MIGSHKVGLKHPTYFIADIASNHDGDLERAKELIYMGAEAGMNAAKFQNFSADTLVSDFGFKNLLNKTHQSDWKKSVSEVYNDASLPIDWTDELKETCNKAGVDYFTSLYDPKHIEWLSKYVCAWKIGSGDITWHDLIERFALDGKPILLATGASSLEEVKMAMNVAQLHASDIVLMQCNTNYSGLAENFNYIDLNVLKNFSIEFPDAVLGLSDHTTGHSTVLGAVALGARVIEKHFTDNASREGSDHSFSMQPGEWKEMVDRTRELEAALGKGVKRVMDNEKETIIVQRRSLRAVRDLRAGDILLDKDIFPLRPCPIDAIEPYRSKELIGKKLKQDIIKGDYIKLVNIE